MDSKAEKPQDPEPGEDGTKKPYVLCFIFKN